MKSFFTRDVLITAGVLGAAFLISLLLERQLDCSTSVPALFVLAVFLITLNTQGYGWGIVGSLISVLSITRDLVSFTFPYFRFTFSAPENLISALVMLIVTVLTSTLTTKVKRQEKEKAGKAKRKKCGPICCGPSLMTCARR